MSLAHGFESIKQSHDGSEVWSARELYPILGYTNRNKFQLSIEKAKESIKTTGNIISDHFYPEVKLIHLPKGAIRKIDDLLLTRYACYQIAMNGDVRKPEIAGAQLYFATQTRKQELTQQYLADKTRYEERLKHSETDKELSKAMIEEIATVKARGQETFYKNVVSVL